VSEGISLAINGCFFRTSSRKSSLELQGKVNETLFSSIGQGPITTLAANYRSEEQGGRMNSCVKMCVSLLTIATLLFPVDIPARAQDKPHVVSLADLNKDFTQAAQTRQANEEVVRTLFSSEQGQKAMKSAHLDYEKVDKAVGQLSDEDLAKLAARSSQAQADFAAGRISNTAIIVIVVLIAATIILVTIAVQLNHS